MKTAESHIKDEIGKLLVNLAVAKVNHWAKKELNYIRFALNYPVVLPVSDKQWIIGDYYIKEIGPHGFKVIRDNRVIHIFYNKQAAVLYAALSKIRFYNNADNILNADKEVSKLYDDLQFYSQKVTSKTNKDLFKKQLWRARHDDIKLRFISARQDLEKRISCAKYIKIWDKII